MKLEKGMCVSTGLWWFVVVEVVYAGGKTLLHCLCDYANNTYALEPSEITHYLSTDEISQLGYEWPERYDDEDEHSAAKNLRLRKIPYDIITEVLLGAEDDRFAE